MSLDISEDAMEDDRPAAKGAPAFRAINGDREALERRLMWAILFDYPDKEALKRRLTPAANSTLLVDDPSE